MARKKDNTQIDAFDGLDFSPAEEPATKGYQKIGYNPKSLNNLRTRESGTAKPKAYMQLNIYEYEDYIYRMSKVNNKTMTQYVLDLIEADMQSNSQAYDGLKMIESLNKPARIAKNKPKTK